MSKIIHNVYLVLSFVFIFLLGYYAGQGLGGLTGASSVEQHSPSDWISESQLKVEHDGLKIELDDFIIARFTDTNSMDPVLDYGANAIEIKPGAPEDIRVGDIVSYKNKDGKSVIHRIIEIKKDDYGLYYMLKGDNNPVADPYRIRFSDIEYVLVAVLY